MNREEILEKSRIENRNQDVYEKEVIIAGSKYACLVAGLVATIFVVVQIVVGEGKNYGLYAIVLAMPMGGYWYKFAKLRKKHDLVAAVWYTLLVVGLMVVHISALIAASTIL